MAQSEKRASLRTQGKFRVWWGVSLAVFCMLGATAWAQPRPTPPGATRANMNKAFELYKKGEYEMAAFYYTQAQAGQTALSKSERNDLTKLIQQNNVARKLRHEGQLLIKQAHDAIQAKEFAQAQQLTTKLATNQYLSSIDRQAVGKLQEQLRTIAPPGALLNDKTGKPHTAKKWFQPLQMVKGLFTRDGKPAVEPEPEDVMPSIPDEPAKKPEPAGPTALDTMKNIMSWPSKMFGGKESKTSKNPKADKSTKTKPKQRPPTPTELTAMKLIQQGYQALAKNDFEAARKSAFAAKETGAKLDWWEHNPENLLRDIERRQGTVKAPEPKGKELTTVAKKITPPEARRHLAAGRTLLSEGKIEEAAKMATLAGSVPEMRWGLFGDNPDKLQRDIRAARTNRDRAESVKMLADARKLFAKGELKQAKIKAFEAQKLHGPHNIWDFGDRPSRLLAEIAQAEKLNRPRPELPPLPVPAYTKAPNTLPEPKLPGATPPVKPAPQIDIAKHPVKPTPPIAANRPGGLAAKQRAMALLAEARQLQTQGNLIEARQKVKEAETIDAPFGPNESDPRSVLVGLAAQCDREVKKLMQQATHRVTNMQQDPNRFQSAARELAYARKLAAAYGQDPKRVDDKIAWLLTVGGNAPKVGQLVSAPKQNQPADPRTKEAWDKLAKARLELRAGNTAAAMHLARGVFDILPSESTKMIRSIEAEEHNQRILEANRTAHAAAEAFKYGKYKQAKRILDQLDVRLLSDDMKTWVREMGASPKLYEGDVVAVGVKPVFPGQTGEKPGEVTIGGLKPVQDDSLTAKVRALEDVQFQKLREEGLAVQRKAIDYVQARNIDDAVRILKDYMSELNHVKLDDTRLALLKRPVESRLQQYKTIQARVSLTNAQNTIGVKHNEGARQSAIQKQQQEVAVLMKKYASLYNEGRYKEAKQTAMMALEIDYKNRAASAALTKSKIAEAQQLYDNAKHNNEEMFIKSLDLDRGPYADMKNPMKFDPEYYKRVKGRKGVEAIMNSRQNAIEQSIERKLTQPISLTFKNTPLAQVLDDLQKISGVNVVPDTKSFEDANVRMDLPMTIAVEDISMKSALTLLLQKADLTYVVKNEVLMITTRDGAKGKLKRVTYSVADLIIPVENKPLPDIYSLQKALERHVRSQNGPSNAGGPVPYTGPFSLGAGQPITEYSSGVHGPRPNGMPGAMPFANRSSNGRTLEEVLIELITQSVEPETWNNMGGAGTIQYFPLGMALVINQTQDVQEQVLDLLKALRRLQDLEVAIEMRLVSVSESFFERIGVDFDFTLLTSNKRYESQLLTGQFQPAGFINQFKPGQFVSGLTPAGSFTPDLNIPINNSSFNFSAPPFGGFPGTLGQTGGLSLGLAFLSDIQVFMFMEAAQGDRRTNVMQAPKITVFNGQTANISVQDQVFFLTGVELFQSGFGNIFFNPQNQPFPLGVNLQVTPVVSADRRFVRMNLTPVMTNLASATVPLIPISIPVPTILAGPGTGTTTGPPETIFQMFFQQPTFTTIQVSTTVNVPDGGTVLLGGLKTLSEGRNEFGPPILSKIPYLSRLFRNIGYGREAQSLMIMVTPRIIINEEEEQIFLGEIEPIPRE